MDHNEQYKFSNDIYRLIFENAADPIFVLDTEGNFIEVNKAACDHIGYSREELLCMRPEQFNESSSLEKFPERIAQLSRDRKATFEAVHIHRNGTHIPVEMHIQRIEQSGTTYTINICRNITLRKQHELQYLTMVQATSDGFWVASASNARFLDVNEAYCRMVGYTRSELLSMHITDLEAIESQEEIRAHILKIMSSGHDLFETRHRHKDGYLVDLEISVSYSSQRGGILFVFIRDITERKYLERRVVQAQIELEDLYNNAPCGYHSVDDEGKILRINRTEADWLGYSCEELQGKKITDFHAPLSRSFFASDFQRFKREGRLDNVEADLVRKDGSIFTVLLNSLAEYDVSGNYLRNRTTVIDITDYKRVLKELHDSEEKFRQLFERSPIGIAIADESQTIIMANPSYCNMFGYTPEELLHLTISDLTHPEHRDQTRNNVKSLLDGLLPFYSFEKKFLKKNGEAFWGRVTATEVTSSIPNKRYIMGLLEDISDRIEQQERRLKEVQEQKNVLIREVHHRIKNNLQGVINLLRQQAATHPGIEEAIGLAIKKIYSIATVHGLQSRTSSEAINLFVLVEQIIAASECSIKLTSSLLSPAFLCKNEGVPIALILNELVTNACKYSRISDRTSCCHSIFINLSGDSTRVAINIANSYDDNSESTRTYGAGLNLVKSLMPKKSARLEFEQQNGVFSATLELFSPVVTSGG